MCRFNCVSILFIDLLSLLILVRLLLSFPCQVNPRKIALFMCRGKYMEVCMIHLSFFIFLFFLFYSFLYIFSEFSFTSHFLLLVTFFSFSFLFLLFFFILFSTQSFYSNFSMCNSLRKFLVFLRTQASRVHCTRKRRIYIFI